MATSQPPQSLPLPAPPLSLFSVLSESKRIINAHSRHFLALSVLFLLPFSFSFTVFPTLLLSPRRGHPPNTSLLLSSSAADSLIPSTATLLLSLAYALFLSLLSLLASASISSSVLHGFYGRPVRLLSAVRSAAVSFLPLLATSLIIDLIAATFAALAALLLFIAVTSAKLLGFQLEYNSPYFIGVLAAIATGLLAALVFLYLNWTLAPAVVVAESTWGFSVLRRSAGLIRGMRRVAASLLAFLSLSAAAIAWVGASMAASLGGDGVFRGWESLESVVLIAFASAFMTIVLLYSVAANTVLYMYCKAMHGELATEIAEEFAAEYISLPFDEEKVPHIVSVAHA